MYILCIYIYMYMCVCVCIYIYIYFSPMLLLKVSLFLYPLKTSESLWFSDVSKGYRNRTLD